MQVHQHSQGTELKHAIVEKIDVNVELPHLRRCVEDQEAVHEWGIVPGEEEEEVWGGGRDVSPPLRQDAGSGNVCDIEEGEDVVDHRVRQGADVISKIGRAHV